MPAAARRVRAEVSMRRKFVRITRLSWVCCVVAFELMAPAASSAGPGNFNGDARAELAVFRPSTGRCYVQGQADSVCGAPGDIPVPGDYNGDGRMGLGMYRPSTGVWSLGDAGITVTFGSGGAIPVPGGLPYERCFRRRGVDRPGRPGRDVRAARRHSGVRVLRRRWPDGSRGL